MKSRFPAETMVAFALFAVAVFFRMGPLISGGSSFLPNFSPLTAIALCGGVYLSRRLAFALPLAILFISDLILNAHYGAPLVSMEMLSRYIAFGCIAALGYALRGHARVLYVMGGAIAGSLGFYAVTNTASWLGSPAYAKTVSGWAQALTVGTPGYPPTWVFFQNTFVSDLLFTGLFLASMAVVRRGTDEAEVPAGSGDAVAG